MSGNFSFDSIKNFDNHILSSIPRYEELNGLIHSFLEYFVKEGYSISDIGCSTGRLLFEISDKYASKNIRLLGYDLSENLLPNDSKKISFIKLDLEKESSNLIKSDVFLSIFTNCFIRDKYRYELIQNIYEKLSVGGCFIMTDKIYSSDAHLQDLMTFIFYDYKRKKFKSDEILDKEISLRAIQRPFTEEQNMYMLKSVGFKKIDTFWKHLNFQGYLCIK